MDKQGGERGGEKPTFPTAYEMYLFYSAKLTFSQELF